MDLLNYYPLFIIFVIAWGVPLILSWLEIGKLPSVIVEIVMGVIIGPFVLDIVHDTPYMDFLASTGFLFLIFLAGLEIDINKIINSFPSGRIKRKDLVSNTLILALTIYFGSLIISIPFSWLLSLFIEADIVFYAMLFPTVALSITVPILKADGDLKRKFGQVMLMEGAIATVMSIILITVYSGILKKGFEFEIFFFTVIFALFIVTYMLGKKLVKVRAFQKVLYRLENASGQIRVRGAVVLLLLFVILAQAINTELIMGAFFAGALLSLFVNKERSALLFKLDGMSYGFFIPIFFIMVGVNLDLSALTQFRASIPFIMILTAGFFITQIIPALSMTKIFGLRKSVAGGALLTARLGLTIATAQIGLSLGVISSADNAGIVSASIITSLLAPLGYKLMNKSEEDEHNNIILLGGSRASLFLAERFKMHNISVSTFLQKKDMMLQFDDKSLGYKQVEELNETFLSDLKLYSGDLVIVLTEYNSLNEQLAKYIKTALNHGKIITKKQSVTRELVEFQKSGLKLIDNDELAANHIEDMVMRPNAIDSLSTSFDIYSIQEITVRNKQIHRKLVKEIAFPQTGSLVIQKRNGEVFIPHGNTRLLIGDQLTVIGNGAALTEFRSILVG